MTVKEIYPQFLEFKKTRIKASALTTYAWQYEKWIEPYFGEEDVSEGIDNKRINVFIEYLLGNGLSKKTADSIKTTLGSIMSFAHMKWDIPRPTWKIYWASNSLTENRKIKFFTKAECKKVFDLMNSDPDPRLLGIVIGLTTGMRIGEIVGLRFSDINFENKTIHIQRTIQRLALRPGIDASGLEHAHHEHGMDESKKKSVIIVSPPKTDTSNRIVPIAKMPLKWLKRYAAISDAQCYVITLKHHVLEARTYRNYYYKILEKLELPLLNPHCMRHTFATQLLHNKVDVATIASILGHSSPAITLEIYSHTNEEEKAKAVNGVFGKLFK